eukprot:m.67021 g.67021  ORF g.67021 m.67021 type:complete len:242 (-) comp14088_c2_seq1:1137-1862(-)
MGKVKVGSQKAVDTLEAAARGTVDDYVRQRKWSKAQRAQFRAAVSQATAQAFQIVHRSVSVGGSHDWDYTLRDEDVEPKDRAMLAQLKAKQLSVYEAIEKIADLRKTAPEELTGLVTEYTKVAAASLDKYATACADAVASAAAAAESTASPSRSAKKAAKAAAAAGAAEAAAPSSNELAQRLEKCVGRLTELTKTLPDLIPRYDRLLVVLNEEERLARSKTEAVITQGDSAAAAAAASTKA